jgi:hypothetical protein
MLDDRQGILKTCGPYNGMFLPNSGEGNDKAADSGEGFSIDVPVETSTMMASGFVVLKVQNERGEHLICLDARPGGLGGSASKGKMSEYVGCLDVETHLDRASQGQKNIPTQERVMQIHPVERTHRARILRRFVVQVLPVALGVFGPGKQSKSRRENF